MPNRGQPILAPISIGELIDKITILEIKAERISDPAKLRNIATELAGLRAIRAQTGLDTPGMEPHVRELKLLNIALWETEDEIRELEAKRDFGARFIALARSVYQTNDKRAAVKNKINHAFGSAIVEEKSYKGG
jgi:orotidine-5'-phosphate decarboxylase